MAIPQLMLARQAVALLGVAKEVYAGISRLPPDERAAVAEDTARLRELMTRLSGRALTKFGGPRGLGAKQGRFSSADGATLTAAEVEELRRLVARLSAFAAVHVSESADRTTGRGARGKMTKYAVKFAAGKAGERLADYGGRTSAGPVEPATPELGPTAGQPSALRTWLAAWVGEHAVDASGVDAATEAAAFLLVRHGLLPSARAAGLGRAVQRMADVDTPALAGAVLDEVYAEYGGDLHAAARRRGLSDAAAWTEVHQTTQAVVERWGARHRAILDGTNARSTDVAAVREQVETLLAFKHEVEAEPGGDLSFGCGSTCMFVGVDGWEGHAVVRMSMAVLLGAEPTHELLMRIATGGTYLFGHLMAIERDGLIDMILLHALLGDHLDAPELDLTVAMMTEVADGIDDRLATKLGDDVYDAALTHEMVLAPMQDGDG